MYLIVQYKRIPVGCVSRQCYSLMACFFCQREQQFLSQDRQEKILLYIFSHASEILFSMALDLYEMSFTKFSVISCPRQCPNIYGRSFSAAGLVLLSGLWYYVNTVNTVKHCNTPIASAPQLAVQTWVSFDEGRNLFV